MAEFSNGYILGFAGALCVVASLALAGTHAALKPLQDVNRVRDFQKDVLSALSLPEDGHVPAGAEIDQLFGDRVGELVVDRASGKVAEGKTKADVDAAWEKVKGTKNPPDLLSVYTRRDGEKVGAYAMELRGRGLWGPISGYIALGGDAATISGVVFFAPSETPGLGYEITADAFKRQWVGRKVVDASGAPSPIRVAKGKAVEACADAPDRCVDGVSGATLTGNGVTAMVDAGVTMYDPFFRALRSQGGAP